MDIELNRYQSAQNTVSTFDIAREIGFVQKMQEFVLLYGKKATNKVDDNRTCISLIQKEKAALTKCVDCSCTNANQNMLLLIRKTKRNRITGKKPMMDGS
eukprot:404840_1